MAYRSKHPMKHENTDIEVEVIEIDGVSPAAPRKQPLDQGPSTSEWQDWRTWKGRITKLDSRWWPLWLLLGIIAATLLLTVGLVVGVIVITVRLILRIVRAITQHPALS